MRYGATDLLSGKRVVFVLAGEVLGGAEVNAIELAVEMARVDGAKVAICALDDRPGRGRVIAADHGLPWHCIRTPWTGSRAAKAGSLARAAAALRRLAPDVIVAATNLPNVVCGLTWRATGASLFVWNQCDVYRTARFDQRVFRRALIAAPLIVTTAYHAREWLVEQFDADPARVHVVRSNVEVRPPRQNGADWRACLGIGEQDVVVCMLAHLNPGKNHATLLRGWRVVVDRLDADERRPMLLLAGRDAGSGDALKALAFDLDLREHVRFLGEVDDVGGLLEAADLAVFSSRSECLGRGATEPMAAGLAVVGADVPGIREAVGVPGEPFLAPPEDAHALADAILRLATDYDLRAAVGRANAELIRSRQSREATTRVYVELVATMLGRRASRRQPRSA